MDRITPAPVLAKSDEEIDVLGGRRRAARGEHQEGLVGRHRRIHVEPATVAERQGLGWLVDAALELGAVEAEATGLRGGLHKIDAPVARHAGGEYGRAAVDRRGQENEAAPA